jgi:hypothetical protein
MSLGIPLTVSSARIEANPHDAQESIATRTARGMVQPRMNGRRDGGPSPIYRDRVLALLSAPPGAADKTARTFRTPGQAAHPLFTGLVEMFRQAETRVVQKVRQFLPLRSSGRIRILF